MLCQIILLHLCSLFGGIWPKEWKNLDVPIQTGGVGGFVTQL